VFEALKIHKDNLKQLINKADVVGKTALHYAAENHREELIRLLLENGSDPSLSDKDYNTPLHLVCKGSTDI